MPRKSERAKLDELEDEVERRVRALEEPEFFEVHLAFDPSPLPAAVHARRTGVEAADPPAHAPAVEQRVGEDGKPFWVLKVVVT